MSIIDVMPENYPNRFIENLNRFLSEISLYLSTLQSRRIPKADKKFNEAYTIAKKSFSDKEISIELALDKIIAATIERKAACHNVKLGGEYYVASRSAQEARLFRALTSYLDVELRLWGSYFPAANEEFVRSMNYLRPNFLIEAHQMGYVEFDKRDDISQVVLTRRYYERTGWLMELQSSDVPMIGDFKDIFPVPDMIERRADI